LDSLWSERPLSVQEQGFKLSVIVGVLKKSACNGSVDVHWLQRSAPFFTQRTQRSDLSIAMGDPLFTPALVGAAVSLLLTDLV